MGKAGSSCTGESARSRMPRSYGRHRVLSEPVPRCPPSSGDMPLTSGNTHLSCVGVALSPCPSQTSWWPFGGHGTFRCCACACMFMHAGRSGSGPTCPSLRQPTGRAPRAGHGTARNSALPGTVCCRSRLEVGARPRVHRSGGPSGRGGRTRRSRGAQGQDGIRCEQAAVAASPERLRHLDVMEEQRPALDPLELVPHISEKLATRVEDVLVVVGRVRRVGVSYVER